MHYGEQAVGFDPPLFAAPGGKKSLQVASLAFILYLHHILCRKRSVYSGTRLLADLKFQEVSGQYKNFEWHQQILNY